MSSFTGSFDHTADDTFNGYDPTFSNFDANSVQESAGDSSPLFNNQVAFGTDDGVFSSQTLTDLISPPSMYSTGGGFSAFSSKQNGTAFDGEFCSSEGPILPPPADMYPEEGFALREWRRENMIRLAEKEKKEKEMVQQIIEEAEEFKVEFYRKRVIACQNKKDTNRESEKLFLANQVKFHKDAEKDYWKAGAELIPREVPTLEKRGKKDKDNKPSVTVIQGPKPGKPTDLSRMRQILLKLKHNTPPHMMPKPPPTEAKKKAKTDAAAPSAAAGAAGPPEEAALAIPEVLAAV